LRPDRVPASIEDIVRGVVGRLERVIGAHEVILNVDPDLPDVAVDLLQMERVVANLVENAAKFAPAGTPIEISGRSVDGHVRVEVADHGPGISPIDRERVFEPFEGLPGARSKGAGLGLAICRAIVEAHEGEIRIAESPLPGTRVVFELPVEATPA
jgi:two-component system sensor histidine kinase KdpD